MPAGLESRTSPLVMSGVSPNFLATYEAIVAREMGNPDPRVPMLLTQVPVYLQRDPSPNDFAAAGVADSNGVLLTGLHFGQPDLPYGDHTIILFENPMRQRAALEGISLEARLTESLLHEFDHTLGACPIGHLDCTIAEIQRTYDLGGSLNANQIAFYRSKGILA